MLKYQCASDTNDGIIVKIIDEGKYKDVFVRIVDLQVTENYEIEFNFELAKEHADLFDDDKFKANLEEIAGDIVQKSIKNAEQTYDNIATIETTLQSLLTKKNIKTNEDRLLWEQFMDKNYIVNIINKKPIAYNTVTQEEYDLTNDEVLQRVIIEVFPIVEKGN